MKAFFGKIWSWALAHKAIAITLAVVLVAGVTCAIVLPIALHEHSFATEWSADATNHWHAASCRHTEATSDLAAHTYDNACDTKCNVCSYERTADAHVYDNACDADCNVCTAPRTPEAHVYDNACDTDCNVCTATRTITHDHAATLTKGETTHWYACSVCGDKKDEAAHAFTETVATTDFLKEEATATTKAVYYKSCVCGKAGTETFETDKESVTVEITLSGNKTYDGIAVSAPAFTVTPADTQGAVILYKVKGADDATYTADAPVNVGVYTVKVSIPETVTHVGASATADVTITKGAAEITDIDVNGTAKTYDGVAVNPPTFTASFRDGAVVEYKKQSDPDTAYTTDLPVNAGIYTVRVTIPETDNYTGAVLTENFAILKASVEIDNTVLANDSITYGAPIEPMATANGYTGEFKYEYKVSGADDSTYDTVRPTAVGQYVVKVTLQDTDNYNEESALQAFEIIPAAITGLNLTAPYNGMSTFSVCLGEEYDDLWISVTIDSIDVGTNKTVTGASVTTPDANYTVDVSGIVSFDVLPAELTIRWELPESLAYDGSAKEATAMIVDGVVTGEDVQLQVTLSTLTPDNVNPGPVRYEATLTGTHAGNYEMDIPFVDFSIYECEHNTLDQGGSCSVCGEFRGIEIDATGGNDVTLTTGFNYFRFVSADYTVYNNANYKISFAGYDGSSGGAKLYARTSDGYADADLGADVFAAAVELVTSYDDYYYLVIDANEEMEISIIISENLS